jgi:hypothetical protein
MNKEEIIKFFLEDGYLVQVTHRPKAVGIRILDPRGDPVYSAGSIKLTEEELLNYIIEHKDFIKYKPYNE